MHTLHDIYKDGLGRNLPLKHFKTAIMRKFELIGVKSQPSIRIVMDEVVSVRDV